MIPRRTALLALVSLPVAARAQGAGPSAPIAVLDNALLNAMKAGKATPFPKRFNMLAPAIEQALDLPQILRASVGLVWADLPASQKTQLAQVFRDYTVANYAANFDSYSGQSFRILPTTRSAGADRIVETEIVPASGTPTRIDYVMRQTAQGWKAVDVLLTGAISRVAVQRSDFRSLLRSGNATALIASLQRKVSSLSGGTLRS